MRRHLSPRCCCHSDPGVGQPKWTLAGSPSSPCQSCSWQCLHCSRPFCRRPFCRGFRWHLLSCATCNAVPNGFWSFVPTGWPSRRATTAVFDFGSHRSRPELETSGGFHRLCGIGFATRHWKRQSALPRGERDASGVYCHRRHDQSGSCASATIAPLYHSNPVSTPSAGHCAGVNRGSG